VRGHAGEPVHLALGDLADLVGKFGGLEPLAQLVALRGLLVVLAELRADLAQLLAQEFLPLGVADLPCARSRSSSRPGRCGSRASGSA
jgi:hypothetical protein